MKRLVLMRRLRGFTLIELMVVVAVVAVVLMTAAPSFRDLIVKQRLQGTAEQLMTDVQFARTEAASRQATTHLRFKTVSGMTCYIVHICDPNATAACTCDCSAAAGSRCADPKHEIRTIQLFSKESVTLFPVNLRTPPSLDANTPIAGDLAFDPSTGGVYSNFPSALTYVPPPAGSDLWIRVGKVGAATGPSVRVVINRSGRPRPCAQGGGKFSGLEACK